MAERFSFKNVVCPPTRTFEASTNPLQWNPWCLEVLSIQCKHHFKFNEFPSRVSIMTMLVQTRSLRLLFSIVDVNNIRRRASPTWSFPPKPYQIVSLLPNLWGVLTNNTISSSKLPPDPNSSLSVNIIRTSNYLSWLNRSRLNFEIKIQQVCTRLSVLLSSSKYILALHIQFITSY